MNIEELRDYCLSLGDVEEKFPFAKIKGGGSVLVFYVCGHMFAFLDIADYDLDRQVSDGADCRTA